MIKKHIKKLIVIAIFIVVTFTVYGCDSNKELVISNKEGDASIQSDTSYIEEKQIYVYVTGKVKNPGVYKVHKDCRIYEIIEMAGGFLEDADKDSINLADKAYDGMKITIYAIGEERVQDTGSHTDTGLVNINTATKEELMTLPGIGESKAESIIEYRNIYGSFQCIEDIMNISGIKEGAFNKIKTLITI